MSECDFTPVIAVVSGVAANVIIVSKQVVDFPMLFQRITTRRVPEALSFWFFVSVFLFQNHRVVYYTCWSTFEGGPTCVIHDTVVLEEKYRHEEPEAQSLWNSACGDALKKHGEIDHLLADDDHICSNSRDHCNHRGEVALTH